jgi:hypothetical protein
MWIAEDLAHDEPAARLDHARELAKRLLLIRNLSEHGDEVGGIEAAVGVGQFARVALGRPGGASRPRIAVRMDKPTDCAATTAPRRRARRQRLRSSCRSRSWHEVVRRVVAASTTRRQALQGDGVERDDDARARHRDGAHFGAQHEDATWENSIGLHVINERCC